MMHFVPAAGTIEWTIRKTSDRSEFKHDLLNNAKKISDRSLAQFTRPPGIDPKWTIEGEFSFTIL